MKHHVTMFSTPKNYDLGKVVGTCCNNANNVVLPTLFVVATKVILLHLRIAVYTPINPFHKKFVLENTRFEPAHPCITKQSLECVSN